MKDFESMIWENNNILIICNYNTEFVYSKYTNCSIFLRNDDLDLLNKVNEQYEILSDEEKNDIIDRYSTEFNIFQYKGKIGFEISRDGVQLKYDENIIHFERYSQSDGDYFKRDIDRIPKIIKRILATVSEKLSSESKFEFKIKTHELKEDLYWFHKYWATDFNNSLKWIGELKWEK